MTDCLELPVSHEDLRETLSFTVIGDMSLEELIAHKAQLPSELDISSLTPENFGDFKYWLDVANSENDKVRVISKETFTETNKFGLVSELSIPLGGGFHEGLHALAVKLTGGDFGKIVVSSREYSTEIWCPTQESYISVLLTPNIVAPTLGFYLMHKGWHEKNGAYLGLGFTTMMMGINPDPFEGDCYHAISLLSGLSGEAATLATVGFLAALYPTTFLLGKGAYKLEKGISFRYNKLRQKPN